MTKTNKTNHKKWYLVAVLLVIVIGVVILLALLFGCKKKTNPITPPTPPQDNSNYLIANGVKHYIDVSGTFLTDRTMNDPDNYEFTELNGGAITVLRSEITTFNLTDLPALTNDTAPNAYLRYMCYRFSNLTTVNISFPNLISVGDDFCLSIFEQCSNLQTISNFIFPQSITTVGMSFCYYAFFDCSSLASLPKNFNLPQSITTAGAGFCYSMFSNCTGLENDDADLVTITIPSPTTTGSYFCQGMFSGCDGLTNVPNPVVAGSVVTINAN